MEEGYLAIHLRMFVAINHILLPFISPVFRVSVVSSHKLEDGRMNRTERSAKRRETKRNLGFKVGVWGLFSRTRDPVLITLHNMLGGPLPVFVD